MWGHPPPLEEPLRCYEHQRGASNELEGDASSHLVQKTGSAHRRWSPDRISPVLSRDIAHLLWLHFSTISWSISGLR